jgi:hypothetical protein
MRAIMLAAFVGSSCASSITSPCPITTPPPAVVTPPPPVGEGPNPNLVFSADRGVFLYGNGALLVILPADGVLHPSDSSRGLAGGVKFPWWRVARGDLAVATQRLDGVTLPLSADVPSGYGEVGFQPSGLNFASPGCWQVTGAVGGRTLRFVVSVSAV